MDFFDALVVAFEYIKFLFSFTFVLGEYELPYALIPPLCLVLISIALPKRKFKSWRVKASKKWLENFRKNKNKYTSAQRFRFVREVDCYLFEDVLMSCFEERGYSVTRTKLSWDEGSDGYVTINKVYMAVQAKRYTGRISKQHVKDLYLLVQKKRKVKKGIFIHTGKSSGPILDYIKGEQELDMISGVDRLIKFLDGEDTYIFNYRLNGITNSAIFKS